MSEDTDWRTTERQRLLHRINALEARMEALNEPSVEIPPGDFRGYLLAELRCLRDELERAELELMPSVLEELQLDEPDPPPGPGELERAQDPQASPEALRALAQSPSLVVRRAVARNPQTPPEVLADLVRDYREGVRWAAAGNPHTPPEAIRLGMQAEEGTTPDLRVIPDALLGRLDSLPANPALWMDLWAHTDPEGREKIQAHPYGAQIVVMMGLGGH